MNKEEFATLVAEQRQEINAAIDHIVISAAPRARAKEIQERVQLILDAFDKYSEALANARYEMFIDIPQTA